MNNHHNFYLLLISYAITLCFISELIVHSKCSWLSVMHCKEIRIETRVPAEITPLK